jgi:hypothetical protein
MESSEVNFATPNALDPAILQFTALVLIRTLQEATGEALYDSDEDDKLAKLVVPPPLSPRKPKNRKTEDRSEETSNRRPLAQVSCSDDTSHSEGTSVYDCIHWESCQTTYGRVDDGKLQRARSQQPRRASSQQVQRVSSRQALRVRCAPSVSTPGSVGAFNRAFGVIGGRTPGGRVLTGAFSQARRARRTRSRQAHLLGGCRPGKTSY